MRTNNNSLLEKIAYKLGLGIGGVMLAYTLAQNPAMPEEAAKSGLENSLKDTPSEQKTGRTYSTSKKGLDMIKQFEGYSEKVYSDVAGKKTIGYGHLIKGNENYEIIGREEAEQLLIKDMVIAEKAVSNLVSVHLTQNQYDALVSFVYNVGRGNFERSTMLIKLNSKNYKGASLEFKRWNKAGGKVVKGLINRRQKEEVLFNEVRSKRWNH